MTVRVNRTSPKSADSRHTPDEPSQGRNPAPNATEDREQDGKTIADELTRLLNQTRELGEYFSYFLAAKTDGMKSSLRHLGLLTLSAAIGFCAAVGLIIIGSWLILDGVAHGFGELFGNRLWLGNIVTGALLLAGLGMGTYYTAATRNSIARKRMERKYERRQARQRDEFGTDVVERATAAAPRKN